MNLKKLKHLSLSFLCALLLSVAGAAQDSPKSLLALARKQEGLAKGQEKEARVPVYEKALELYLQVPGRWPEALAEGSRALLSAAALEKKLGRAEKAHEHLDEVLKIDNRPVEHARALQMKASLYRRAKDYQKAREALQRLLEICAGESKACAKARLSLGSLARQEKRFQDALQRAAEVLEKHPLCWRENVDAVQLHLSVLMKNRQWVQAIAALKEFEERLLERFKDSPKADSVKKALAALPARKALTPIPIANQ